MRVLTGLARPIQGTHVEGSLVVLDIPQSDEAAVDFLRQWRDRVLMVTSAPHAGGDGERRAGAMSAITDDAQINAEICRDLGTDGDLEALLSQFTVEQVRYVIARQDCGSDREAARAVGVSESTVYRWASVVKRVVEFMAQDGVVTALHLRRRARARALAVKVRGLNSRDERVRQSVATELIEWEPRHATQHTEVTTNTVLFTAVTVVEGERLRAEFRKGGETRGGRCAPAMARSCAHGNDRALHVGDIRTPSSSSEGGQ